LFFFFFCEFLGGIRWGNIWNFRRKGIWDIFLSMFSLFFFFLNFLVVISMVNEKSFYSLIYFSLQRGPWFVRFYSLCIFFGEKKKNYTISPPRVNKVWFQWYLIFKFFKSYNCSLYNIFFLLTWVSGPVYTHLD
jgi:hypothetical protein